MDEMLYSRYRRTNGGKNVKASKVRPRVDGRRLETLEALARAVWPAVEELKTKLPHELSGNEYRTLVAARNLVKTGWKREEA